MTTVVGSPHVGLDMLAWDLTPLKGAPSSNRSSTTVTFDLGGGNECALEGTNFTFNHGKLTGGTITSFTYSSGHPQADFSLSGFTMTADAFNALVKDNNIIGFQHAVLVGDDAVTGNVKSDYLRGLQGNDTVSGAEGTDTVRGGWGDDILSGGAGADTMRGGRGHNTFIYDSADDSTDGVYDTLEGFSTMDDKISVTSAVTGIDAQFDAGPSDGTDVDGDLSAALDSAHLGAHHAAVVTMDVDSGALSGPQSFLVVDLNGQAGYQAGEDLAIRIVGARNLDHLTVDTFITPA